jgi:hypothetical protein
MFGTKAVAPKQKSVREIVADFEEAATRLVSEAVENNCDLNSVAGLLGDWIGNGRVGLARRIAAEQCRRQVSAGRDRL